MTLYDLMSSAMLQGNIEVRVMSNDGKMLDVKYFDSVDDLEMCEISRLEDVENYEVISMFAETVVRHFPNSTKSSSCMVIELEPLDND